MAIYCSKDAHCQPLFTLGNRLFIPSAVLWMTKFVVGALVTLLMINVSNASESRVLKLAHVASVDSAIGRGATDLAEEVSKVSGGALSIDIIPRGALGGIGDNWVQMQVGALDMQVIDLPAISLLASAAPVQVSILPFIFRDQAHFRAFAKSELLAQLLLPVLNESGIRYLGIVQDRTPRVVSTTRNTVNHVNDMRGLKIRVPPHPMFVDVFKSWGAIPTPLPGSEIYMALQSGLVDGEDNGVVNLVAGPNIEVINYFSPINWNRSGVAAWISDITWAALSDEERGWLQQASATIARTSRDDYELQLNAAMKALSESGIQVLEPDVESFRQKTRDLYLRYEGIIWSKGLVEKVQALQ